MPLTIQLPEELEKRLRENIPDLEAQIREAFAVQLYRRGQLSHFELAEVLGLDRFEMDEYLQRHNIYEGSLTIDDIEADVRSLESILPTK